MNFSQLSARLDPSYHVKMQHLQAKLEGDYALANYKGQQQAQLEYDKQQNARQVERERRDYEVESEAKRVETSREIEADKHRNRLELLDIESTQHIKRMTGERHIQKLSTFDAMEHEVFSGASRNMEMRSQLRGEVFKQLASAVIGEKLAQKQHARDLEKMRLEHDQKKDARVWDQLCSYIFALMENNQTAQAEAYIDKLVKDWEAV